MLGEYSMSTTLTNGLKLPDKGSVDWYTDMQSNYAILDGAVGTVAEHTSALAGKAPLVHTHTKADITDFPVYGTTAGTICEGNDSRLSDARTPVAHTHTKSDITDLFNSVNVWTGNQTYTGMMILNSSSDVVEQFRQKLPKDVSTSSDALVRFNTLVDSAGHNVVVNSEGHWDTYVAKTISLKYKNDSTKQGSIEFRLRSDGTGLLYPQSPFECDLGNSYNKWKTLNGINPGALSLPGTGGYTDIKGDITNLSGGDNTFTAPYDGWVCVKSTNATVIHIINSTWAVSQSAIQSTAGTLCCLCPVMSGQSFKVIVNATSLDYAYIHPCKGNV